jgi:hypothetical protein
MKKKAVYPKQIQKLIDKETNFGKTELPKRKFNHVLNMKSSLHIPLGDTEDLNVSSAIRVTVLSMLKEYDVKFKTQIHENVRSLEGATKYEPMLAFFLMDILSRIKPELNYYDFKTVISDDNEKYPYYLLENITDKYKSILIRFGDENSVKNCIVLPQDHLTILIEKAFRWPFYFYEIIRKSNWDTIPKIIALRKEIEDEVETKYQLMRAPISYRDEFISKIKSATRVLVSKNKKVNTVTVPQMFGMARSTFVDNLKELNIHYDKRLKRFTDGNKNGEVIS